MFTRVEYSDTSSFQDLKLSFPFIVRDIFRHVAYIQVSFRKRGVKLFSTMRLIPLKLHENNVYARGILGYELVYPYLQDLKLSFPFIVRDIFRHVRFFFYSARHASEEEPISSTIFIISGSFSSTFVSDATLAAIFVPTRDCIISRVQCAGFQKFLLPRQNRVLSRILLH